MRNSCTHVSSQCSPNPKAKITHLCCCSHKHVVDVRVHQPPRIGAGGLGPRRCCCCLVGIRLRQQQQRQQHADVSHSQQAALVYMNMLMNGSCRCHH
jgi:hypothetical protein